MDLENSEEVREGSQLLSEESDIDLASYDVDVVTGGEGTSSAAGDEKGLPETQPKVRLASSFSAFRRTWFFRELIMLLKLALPLVSLSEQY